MAAGDVHGALEDVRGGRPVHRDVVEGEEPLRVCSLGAMLQLDFQARELLDLAFPGQGGIYEGGVARIPPVGEEAQVAVVQAEDGDAEQDRQAGGAQDRAVSPEDNHEGERLAQARVLQDAGALRVHLRAVRHLFQGHGLEAVAALAEVRAQAHRCLACPPVLLAVDDEDAHFRDLSESFVHSQRGRQGWMTAPDCAAGAVLLGGGTLRPEWQRTARCVKVPSARRQPGA